MAESESRDGQGAGDHDTPYTFGHAGTCMRPWDLAHLLVMRGFVQNHRAGVRGGACEGDDDYVIATHSGLLVPATDCWRE